MVAVEIYRQRTQTDMLYLKKEAAIEVARQYNIVLRGYEITGQSLLTRDAEGNWKFAHKSILEFLITKEALGNFSEVQKRVTKFRKKYYYSKQQAVEKGL